MDANPHPKAPTKNELAIEHLGLECDQLAWMWRLWCNGRLSVVSSETVTNFRCGSWTCRSLYHRTTSHHANCVLSAPLLPSSGVVARCSTLQMLNRVRLERLHNTRWTEADVARHWINFIHWLNLSKGGLWLFQARGMNPSFRCIAFWGDTTFVHQVSKGLIEGFIVQCCCPRTPKDFAGYP